jgi:hypothetical protein
MKGVPEACPQGHTTISPVQLALNLAHPRRPSERSLTSPCADGLFRPALLLNRLRKPFDWV